MSLDTFFQDRTVVLPPNSSRPVSIGGEFFLATSATGDFYLSLMEGRPTFKAKVGLKFTTTRGQTFSRIVLENRGATAVTVEFYCGVGDISDQRVIIPPSQSVPVINQDAPTTMETSGVISINAAQTVTRNGTNGAGFRRKYIVIQNLDAALNLVIFDPVNATRCHEVLPGQAVPFWTDSAVRINNPGGAAVQVRIVEFFYTS